MKKLTTLLCAMGTVGLAVSGSAQVFQTHFEFDPGAAGFIPDGNANGTFMTGVVANAPTSISTNSFKVTLEIEPGVNGVYGLGTASVGDLFITLQGPTVNGVPGPLAVLMSRVGSTTGAALGYSEYGGKFVFYDGADDPTHKDASGTPQPFADVHWYNEGSPFYVADSDYMMDGIFKTDGRYKDSSGNLIDPESGAAGKYATAPRDYTLAVFQGLNPNGEWTLFAADLSEQNAAVITSWGLDFTPIPEPQEYAVAIGLGLIGFALYRRRTVKLA